MSLLQLLRGNTAENLLSVDIGSNSIKISQIDLSGHKPRLVAAALAPTPAGAFKSHVIIRPKEVAETVKALVSSNEISTTKVVTAVPGPTAFIKRVTMGYLPLRELETNLAFEASNYIPHSLSAVRLDFQVIRAEEGGSMEVMLVAVKNEVVESLLETLILADLDPVILDVDYFAFETLFEQCYPDQKGKMVALVDLGSRFSTVNLLQGGTSLFHGDVSVGGRVYTDALCEAIEVKPREAEMLKRGEAVDGVDATLVKETIERTNDHVASELHRQLGFFWNACSTDEPIEQIYLSGGGCMLGSLRDELTSRTGIDCEVVNPFAKLEVGDEFDTEYLSEIAPFMTQSLGLAFRRLGDKKHAVSET